MKANPMRVLYMGALVLLAPAASASAQSAATPAPGDVVLVLVCPATPCRFRQGENRV